MIDEIRAESRTKGLTEGHAKGRAKGLTEAIEVLCPLLDIPLGPEQRTHMAALHPEGLLALLQRLHTERRWPPR